MSETFSILLTSAITIGFLHTAIGIDHSMPFVILARTRGWTLGRTLLITALCGCAHVLSSVLIALVGLGLGVAGSRLSAIEETRGNWAAWLLVGFGLAYAVVPLWKKRAKKWVHDHSSGHGHGHFLQESVELSALPTSRLMPALFIIFLLGPCEALLPLLMAGGMSLSLGQSVALTLVFSLTTVLTMVGLVAAFYEGAARLRLPWLNRFAAHTHVLSGLTLALSGAAIRILGI